MAHTVSKSVRLLGEATELAGDPSDAYFRAIVGGADITDNTHRCAASLLSGRSLTCLDVGANIGIFTIALSRLCPAGRVMAFEPSPRTFQFLTENIRRNRRRNVQPAQTALAGHDGDLSFHDVPFFEAGSFTVPPDSPLTADVIGSNLLRISCARLDTVLENTGPEHIDFIKIDVEGSELEVLRGAGRTLARCRPAVMLEFNSFALSAFQDITANRFLRTLRDTFPRLFLIARSDGQLRPLETEREFYELVHSNLTNGCVDNLLGTFDNPLCKVRATHQTQGNA
jgi:FkbM family methyltransferase